jgi:hypothetical protein
MDSGRKTNAGAPATSNGGALTDELDVDYTTRKMQLSNINYPPNKTQNHATRKDER